MANPIFGKVSGEKFAEVSFSLILNRVQVEEAISIIWTVETQFSKIALMFQLPKVS